MVRPPLRTSTSLAIAAALLPICSHATAMGAVKLDNYTFDKMIATPGLSTLVKFDKTYAYGEKEDAFKEICKLAYHVKDLLVTEVPIQEYGDKENEDVALRFNVKSNEYPAFLIFKGSVDAPVKFVGFPNPTSKQPSDWSEEEDGKWGPPMITDVTAENLIIWLRQNGVRMPSAGTITELDEVVKRFLNEGMKDEDLQAAKALAEGDHKNDKKAPVYVKIMEKVKAKGNDYVQTELARVQKIMAGKLNEEKKAEMADKIKILNVFANKDL